MYKNIVFDLGGVVLGRDFNRFDEIVGDHFSFFRQDKFPDYWHDFDRGTRTKQEVAEALAADANVSIEEANGLIDKVLELLSEVPETCGLVRRLKEAGCRCYILSNMPKEYWAEIEKFPVAKYFDGAVISSHEQLLKPERAIYERLLERYDLDPAETLFTDDKKTNLLAAEEVGIHTIHFASPDTTPEEIYRLATE